MLEADERQLWVHQAGKIAEMAGVVRMKLINQRIPPELVDLMVLEWWKVVVQPKVEFPDLAEIFRGLEEDGLS